jgi:hypothetical protein
VVAPWSPHSIKLEPPEVGEGAVVETLPPRIR